jgi:P pilus assembly chaperone PapD
LLNRQRVSLFVLLFAPLLLAQGRSASFSLSPQTVTIDQHARIAEFQFSSISARAIVFQVNVEPANEFIVVPSVFRIEPYRTQTFRVTVRNFPASRSEESHRVTVLEVVPGAATPPPNARRYTATLVVAPATPTP